jgi:hypothetical protein
MIIKGGLLSGESSTKEEREKTVMWGEYDQSTLYVCMKNSTIKLTKKKRGGGG